MATYFDAHRLLTIATVLVLACGGCRNASWKTQAGYLKNPRSTPAPTYSNPDTSGELPPPAPSFSEQYRANPYESPDRPYIGDESSAPPLAPHPDAPSVLSIPGTRDANESSLPPTPTAKKSRWNLIPSGFKRPASSKYVPESQTSDAKVDRKWPGKLTKPSASGRNETNAGSFDEAVTSRHQKWNRSTSSATESGTPEDADTATSLPAESDEASTPVQPRTSAAANPRCQANNYFKNPTRSFRSSPPLDPVPHPIAAPTRTVESNQSVDADMPLLLPPSN